VALEKEKRPRIAAKNPTRIQQAEAPSKSKFTTLFDLPSFEFFDISKGTRDYNPRHTEALFQQTVTAIVDGMLTSAWPMNSG
jgi:hypothetical protein